MYSHIEQSPYASDFRVKATLGVAAAALLLLTPFAINNFIQGRYLLGVGSLVIVFMLAVNAFNIRRGRYYPLLTLVGLVPGIILFLVLAYREQGIIGALWCYPALIAFYFMLSERHAWIANIVLFGAIFPQAWDVLEHPLAARVMVTLLATSIFSAIFVRVISNQQRKLEALAGTDSLTGLSNRLRLNATLDQMIQQSQRMGTPMTLLALDLDHFKSINDTLGHDTGDRVLSSFGEILNKRIRSVDKIFRLGGEEFLTLLYDTGAENGRRVAEEFRTAIASHPFIPDRAVTVSIGVATLQPEEDCKAWMKRSDENLYLAKSGGRNRVVS